MNAKHLIKNSIFKKSLFLVACIGILTLALLSVCTSQEADAQPTYDFNEVNAERPDWIISGSGGNGYAYEDDLLGHGDIIWSNSFI